MTETNGNGNGLNEGVAVGIGVKGSAAGQLQESLEDFEER